jgi:hypothetical protein
MKSRREERRRRDVHYDSVKASNEFRCQKIGHPSKAVALGKMRAAQQDGLRIRAVYKCRHCGQWHMTSQSQATAVRIWRAPEPEAAE